MKKILFVILSVGILGCTQQAETDKDQYIDVAHRFLDAIASQDVDRMGQLMTHDFRETGPFHDSTYTKQQSLSNWENAFARTDTIIYDRIYTIYEHIPEGDLKGHWVMDWGTVKELYANNPDTITVDVHAVMRVEDDSVNYVHHFYNVADFYKQLGYEFVPPSEN